MYPAEKVMNLARPATREKKETLKAWKTFRRAKYVQSSHPCMYVSATAWTTYYSYYYYQCCRCCLSRDNLAQRELKDDPLYVRMSQLGFLVLYYAGYRINSTWKSFPKKVPIRYSIPMYKSEKHILISRYFPILHRYRYRYLDISYDVLVRYGKLITYLKVNSEVLCRRFWGEGG